MNRIWISLVLALAYLLAFATVLQGWWQDLLHDPNYSHGIPLAVLLLGFGAWRARAATASATDRISRLWVYLLAVGLGLALLGILTAENSSQRAAAVLLAWAGVEALASPGVASAWRGPLLAMLLVIPWPYVIYYTATAHLQRLSSAAAETFLRLSGVPLAREGNLLRFPGYQLEVVEACSGLRGILALTALAGVIAVWFRCGPRRTALLLACAVPLALVTNLIRLVLTGYAAQLGGPETAEEMFHLAGGLLTFSLGSLVLSVVALGSRRLDPA